MKTDTSSIPERLKKLGYNSYKEYLTSEHWKNLRARFFLESKRVRRMTKKHGRPVCQTCRDPQKNFELHHWTYKRMGNEYLGDLILLCRDCHQYAHDYTNKTGKTLHKGTYHSMRNRRKAILNINI